MLKSRGPTIEPWGTPEMTGLGSEVVPSRTTRSLLSVSQVVTYPVQQRARDT